MVEGSGLENRRACKRTVGSNPTLSAINPENQTGHTWSTTRKRLVRLFCLLDCGERFCLSVG